MQNTKLLRKLFILAIVLVVLGFAGWKTWNIFVFRVTGTSPSLRAVPTDAGYIEIFFNHPLAETNIVKVTDPAKIVKETKQNKKSVRLKLSLLQSGRVYTIGLGTISDTSGKTIDAYTLSFKARVIDFGKLPDNQQKAVLEAQNDKGDQLGDPILSHLPYGGLNFKLTALNEDAGDGNSKLVLEAELLLDKSDVQGDENAAVSEYKLQVTDYIKSLDLKPENYTIRYMVTRPSLF